MIQIPCPFCGPRNSSEFGHAGEPKQRPDVASTTREQWRSYLYVRDNPLGWVRETWFHRSGCRRFIEVERHTGTNEVRWAGRPGAPEQTRLPSSAAEPAAAQAEDGR